MTHEITAISYDWYLKLCCTCSLLLLVATVEMAKKENTIRILISNIKCIVHRVLITAVICFGSEDSTTNPSHQYYANSFCMTMPMCTYLLEVNQLIKYIQPYFNFVQWRIFQLLIQLCNYMHRYLLYD